MKSPLERQKAQVNVIKIVCEDYISKLHVPVYMYCYILLGLRMQE